MHPKLYALWWLVITFAVTVLAVVCDDRVLAVFAVVSGMQAGWVVARAAR